MDAVHFSSKTEEWATPQDFFDKLNEEFHFTLDVCSTHENAKCAKHYTKDDDGLSQDWTGETVWCNPPYGREMPKWIKKCAEHGKQGGAGCHAYSGANRHESISRIHLRQVGDSFCQRQTAFCKAERRKHRRSAFPVNGCCVQTGINRYKAQNQSLAKATSGFSGIQGQTYHAGETSRKSHCSAYE